MKRLIILVLCLLALPASAATPEEATVNIYCQIKLGGRSINTTGSGVFIDERGVILTNAHVGHYFLLTDGKGKSKATCRIRTGSPAKNAYEASLLYISPAWVDEYTQAVAEKGEADGTGQEDFALLYVTKAKKGKLPSSFPALDVAYAYAPQTNVTITGYPADGLDYKQVRDKLKRITADSSITDIRTFFRPLQDILVLAPSEAGQGGVSGGPVADDGTLLGIVSTLSGKKDNGLKGLRAITISHIDRALRLRAGTGLEGMLIETYAIRASTTLATLPADIRTTLETTLRRLR